MTGKVRSVPKEQLAAKPSHKTEIPGPGSRTHDDIIFFISETHTFLQNPESNNVLGFSEETRFSANDRGSQRVWEFGAPCWQRRGNTILGASLPAVWRR